MRLLMVLVVWALLSSGSMPVASFFKGEQVLLPSDTLMVDALASAYEEPVGFFVLAEDSLQKLALEIIRPAEDSIRLANNDRFVTYLLEVLHKEGSMRHPFDSLSTVSMLQPPDSGFRIITWYVPLEAHQFRYFGYIQTTEPSHGSKAEPSHGNNLGKPDDGLTEPTGGKTKLYVLREHLWFDGDVTAGEFLGSDWYGSYYYELITRRHDGRDHYVLLGWRGDNPFSRKRIVEPFFFRDGVPVFGAKVFDVEGGKPYRMVFEYSARVSMGLLYDELYSRSHRKATPMIVFDRLMPMQDDLVGQYRHYVPTGEVFDGLIFGDGLWRLEKDVDARNKKRGDTP